MFPTPLSDAAHRGRPQNSISRMTQRQRRNQRLDLFAIKFTLELSVFFEDASRHVLGNGKRYGGVSGLARTEIRMVEIRRIAISVSSSLFIEKAFPK